MRTKRRTRCRRVLGKAVCFCIPLTPDCHRANKQASPAFLPARVRSLDGESIGARDAPEGVRALHGC